MRKAHVVHGVESGTHSSVVRDLVDEARAAVDVDSAEMSPQVRRQANDRFDAASGNQDVSGADDASSDDGHARGGADDSASARRHSLNAPPPPALPSASSPRGRPHSSVLLRRRPSLRFDLPGESDGGAPTVPAASRPRSQGGARSISSTSPGALPTSSSSAIAAAIAASSSGRASTSLGFVHDMPSPRPREPPSLVDVLRSEHHQHQQQQQQQQRDSGHVGARDVLAQFEDVYGATGGWSLAEHVVFERMWQAGSSDPVGMLRRIRDKLPRRSELDIEEHARFYRQWCLLTAAAEAERHASLRPAPPSNAPLSRASTLSPRRHSARGTPRGELDDGGDDSMGAILGRPLVSSRSIAGADSNRGGASASAATTAARQRFRQRQLVSALHGSRVAPRALSEVSAARASGAGSGGRLMSARLAGLHVSGALTPRDGVAMTPSLDLVAHRAQLAAAPRRTPAPPSARVVAAHPRSVLR